MYKHIAPNKKFEHIFIENWEEKRNQELFRKRRADASLIVDMMFIFMRHISSKNESSRGPTGEIFRKMLIKNYVKKLMTYWAQYPYVKV